MRRIRHAAAVGLAVTLLSLSVAPAVTAAPRVEEPPRSPLLAVFGFADHVVDLFGDWVRSLFDATSGQGDPDG